MKTRRLVISMVLLCASLQVHAVGRLADVRIIDRDTGASLPIHRHGGEYWVAGTPGARYAIAVRSRADTRVLAVTSVDGVNVLSGDTASWDQTGYVFAPAGQYQITGWRKSDSEVAAFAFSAASHSYAGRTGRPEHVGVIGVALFREKAQAAALPLPGYLRGDSDNGPGRQRPEGRLDPASPAPAAAPDNAGSSNLADQRARPAHESEAGPDTPLGKSLSDTVGPRLGTGHGQRESSWVSHTRFERQQTRPDEIVSIRYDSRENLIASGVIPAARRPLQKPLADPFPLSEQATYVPDPPPLRH